ncbi:Rieske (2Fe-2S) protein [Natrialbaceae archaeon GCM10025810]|uniref:Rieske (2Fe-2S) protein n=1 Tax=Halovalidus salilacus TaxID=3075124 RepID=UPI0036126489
MADATRIASLEEVPDESTFLFRVRRLEEGPDGGDELEAILVRTADSEVACWLNYCQHLTHINLDKGSGAPMRNGELVCQNHGAYFESDTGYCTYGPCEGAYLTGIEVAVVDGDVHLADDGYEFVGVGPVETDDLDRGSTSNVEF